MKFKSPPVRDMESKIEGAKRAFTRRFGQSIMPLSVKSDGACVRIYDPESGSWADYDTTKWRVRRIAEYDAGET